LDYEKRFYDSRIGRFLSIDPLEKQFPWYTPYQFAGNTPIQAIDLDGAEEYHYTRIVDKSGKTVGLKLTGVEDIYEWQWKPQTNNDSFLGFALWEKVKNPRKEFIVHEIQNLPIAGRFSCKWQLTDCTATFDSYEDAKKVERNDFVPPASFCFQVGLEACADSMRDGAVPGSVRTTAPKVPVTVEGEGSLSDSSWKGSLDYSKLNEPRKVGPGLETTIAQRKRILEYNKQQNGGVVKSDVDGTIVDIPKKVSKGEKANMNQAEIDHIEERVNGGSNSNKNLRVVSKKQNLDKEVKRKKS
jgi:hypothetical protein